MSHLGLLLGGIEHCLFVLSVDLVLHKILPQLHEVLFDLANNDSLLAILGCLSRVLLLG